LESPFIAGWETVCSQWHFHQRDFKREMPQTECHSETKQSAKIGHESMAKNIAHRVRSG
jgi:hypothetical protein